MYSYVLFSTQWMMYEKNTDRPKKSLCVIHIMHESMGSWIYVSSDWLMLQKQW